MVFVWLILGVVLLAFEIHHFAFYALFGAIGAFAAAVVALIAAVGHPPPGRGGGRGRDARDPPGASPRQRAACINGTKASSVAGSTARSSVKR